MRRAGFRGGISHPAAVRRELANKGVMDKEARFGVAGEMQDSDVVYVLGIAGLVKDKPAIWRPVGGPYGRIGVFRRQQQLLPTGPVGIHLVNFASSAAEQNAATIRRPGRKSVANPRIVGEANGDTTRQVLHPDISGRNTYLVCELCSIR